jgi:tRNA(Arg) A34 adenosine deaminase TadA
MTPPRVCVELPDWVAAEFGTDTIAADDAARMQIAVAAARLNVEHGTGGPFGAAVFDATTGTLVAVGVNLVVPQRNSVLHAEIVAFMFAQQRVGSYTLARGAGAYELFTSCEPCAMCLGATLWSGVQRVVWSATREDAARLRFDEGPVFAASYDYLRERGIRFEGSVLRAEGRAVLELYRARGGVIYNG